MNNRFNHQDNQEADIEFVLNIKNSQREYEISHNNGIHAVYPLKKDEIIKATLDEGSRDIREVPYTFSDTKQGIQYFINGDTKDMNNFLKDTNNKFIGKNRYVPFSIGGINLEIVLAYIGAKNQNPEDPIKTFLKEAEDLFDTGEWNSNMYEEAFWTIKFVRPLKKKWFCHLQKG